MLGDSQWSIDGLKSGSLFRFRAGLEKYIAAGNNSDVTWRCTEPLD